MRPRIARRSVSRGIRRRARTLARRAETSPVRTLGWLALIAALFGAFWLGRASAPAAPAPEACPEPSLVEAAPLSASSTAGLCACPPARRPGIKAPPRSPPASLPRLATEPAVRADPTAATQHYLKESAPLFQACAQSSGAPVRVQLELSVTPEGKVERVRVANLDPLPAAIVSCVEARASALEPPGFDGAQPEVFGLGLVL
ncbi:MAG: hypothetical protein U1E65_14775 [Myxococcota bacterium]